MGCGSSTAAGKPEHHKRPDARAQVSIYQGGAAGMKAHGHGDRRKSYEEPRDPSDPLSSTRTWMKVRDLSEGYSGQVMLAQHIKNQRKVAIKLLKRGAPTTQRADKEVQTMMLLSMHPHIIRFEEVFLTPQHLGIVLEFARGGDLSDYIRRKTLHKGSSMSRALPENLSRVLFQQIMSALEYCHDRGISNRDIKAENILVMDEMETEETGDAVVLKMCDFGFCKDERFDSACKTMCGTAEYIAPEVMEQKPYDGKQADIWSAGVLLFVMLTGRYPFSRACDARLNPGLALQRTFQRIAKAQFEVPHWISAGCHDLLKKMIMSDPADRISVADMFEHPWFCVGLHPRLIALRNHVTQSNDHMALEDFKGTTGQTHAQVKSMVQEAMREPPKRRRDSMQIFRV